VNQAIVCSADVAENRTLLSWQMQHQEVWMRKWCVLNSTGSKCFGYIQIINTTTTTTTTT